MSIPSPDSFFPFTPKEVSQEESALTALTARVSAALLALPGSHPAAESAGMGGWTAPLSVQPVHECLMELQAAP